MTKLCTELIQSLDPGAILKLDEKITIMNALARSFEDRESVADVSFHLDGGALFVSFPGTEWLPLQWDREQREWL